MAADAPAVVAALIGHPAIRRINFTGSTRVGRIVAELAARQLKPVLLELGGKAPLVVLDDADLDEAVKAAAFGAFMNQGQICMSTERPRGRRRGGGRVCAESGEGGVAVGVRPAHRQVGWGRC